MILPRDVIKKTFGLVEADPAEEAMIAALTGEISFADMKMIVSVSHAPRDLQNNGLRINLCCPNPASVQHLMLAGASAPAAQSGKHML